MVCGRQPERKNPSLNRLIISVCALKRFTTYINMLCVACAHRVCVVWRRVGDRVDLIGKKGRRKNLRPSSTHGLNFDPEFKEKQKGDSLYLLTKRGREIQKL